LAKANSFGLTGQLHKCHKALLVGRAPGLNALVNVPAQKEGKGDLIVPVKGITPEAFEALVKWVYYDETKIPTLVACELVSFCQQHAIPPLQKICVEIMEHGVAGDTVLVILNVANRKDMPTWFLDAMKELVPRCVKFAVEHLTDIEFEKLRAEEMNRSIAIDILLAIQKKAQSGHTKHKKHEKEEVKLEPPKLETPPIELTVPKTERV